MKNSYKYYNNILSHYESLKVLERGEMPLPRTCTFQTSNKCNHNCNGCSYRGFLDNEMMSEEDHFKVLEELMVIGVKGFEFCGGGEPFLLPYLNGLLYEIINNDCHFGALTNGSILNKQLVNKFVRFGSYIRISLECSDKDSYSTYKKVSAEQWNLVIANIRWLVRMKEFHNSSLDIGIKFAVSRSNRGLNHYREAISLGNELGVDNIQFKCLYHHPEGLNEDEKIAEDFLLDECIGASNIPIIRRILPTPPEDIPQCVLSPVHTVVDYKGDVFICCYYYYRRKEHLLGNMLDTPFKELWFSENHCNKINDIDKAKCALVDCKFFAHHKNVEEAFKNGRIEFI